MKRFISVLAFALLLCATAAGQDDSSLRPGTRLRVQLLTPVYTKTSQVGDALEAALIEPIQSENSVLLPVGTRLLGRVIAVSPENKRQHTHALLQLSFDQLLLPDGRHLKTQASMQSLGLNPDVDIDGVATIHPLSQDFALKSGRKLWLRVNSDLPQYPERPTSPDNRQIQTPETGVAESQPRDTSKPSGRLGDLLITLNELESPRTQLRGTAREDRHEVLIKGSMRNVGKNPVCARVHARLETSFKLEELGTMALAGRSYGSYGFISELLPAEQLEAEFTFSVKNGTDPLKLKIGQAQSDQGCNGKPHHIFNTEVSIPVSSLAGASAVSSQQQ